MNRHPPGLYLATRRTGCVESVKMAITDPFMSITALATLEACASSRGIGLGVKFLGVADGVGRGVGVGGGVGTGGRGGRPRVRVERGRGLARGVANLKRPDHTPSIPSRICHKDPRPRP